MEVADSGTAHVEGCVLGILCKGQTWKRTN
jgi:uncharacterized protein (DUF2147 family)